MTDLNVSLRLLKNEDAKTVQRFAADERYARFTNVPQPYPADGGEVFVNTRLEWIITRRWVPFAIVLNGEMIGVIEVKPNYEIGTAQCDYGIAPAYWGKGIVTRALELAVDHAFKELDMQRVCATCLERNIGSGRVLEKNGFVEVARSVYNSDKFKDEPACHFELSKENWLARLGV